MKKLLIRSVLMTALLLALCGIMLFTFKYLGIDLGTFSKNLTVLSFYLLFGLVFGLSISRDTEPGALLSLIIGCIVIVIIGNHIPVDLTHFLSLLYLIYAVTTAFCGVISYFVMWGLLTYGK